MGRVKSMVIYSKKLSWCLFLAVVLLSSGVAFSQDDDNDFNWSALDGLDEDVITEPELETLDVEELSVETLVKEDEVFNWSTAEAAEQPPSAPLQGGDSDVAQPEIRGQKPEVSVPALPDVPAVTPALPDIEVVEDIPALPVAAVAEVQSSSQPIDQSRPVRDKSSLATPHASQAYGELLRENLGLRTKIADLSEASESARKAVETAAAENEQLVEIVQKLEGSLTDMTTRIETIKAEKSKSSENQQKLVELEQHLTKAESEKKGLLEELEVARRQVEDKQSKVKAGSDLFKEIEKENAALKNKLVDLEVARRKAKDDMETAKAEAAKESREAARLQAKAKRELKLVKKKEDKLKDELDEAKAQDKDRKKLIEKMLKQIPDLERDLLKLNDEVVEAEAMVGTQDKDLELLRSELRRRDHRFVKAERMAELLEEARREVKMVSNVEKRDMHYNMAVVYAKEGKLRDAEREYLRALKLDPTDPSVHYNLGILYDDEFNKKSKAVLHYKKYLQLAPFSSDTDIVRQWLLDIEMSR